MSKCDCIGCTAAKAAGKLMCRDHWALVPIELQRIIYERYRELRKDWAFLSDVAYLDAVVTAIDRIAKSEGKTGINTYARHRAIAQKKAAGATP